MAYDLGVACYPYFPTVVGMLSIIIVLLTINLTIIRHTRYKLGYSEGYMKGVLDGFAHFDEQHQKWSEREVENRKVEREELQAQVEEFNSTPIPDEEKVPYEVLLSYGVTRIDQLPQRVRELYGVTRTGGVIDGEERE